MFRAPAAPRRLSSRHVPLLHPARRFPASTSPLLAPPRRAAVVRAATRAAEVASTCSCPPCLFLNLKHVLELPTNSLLPSRTCISTAFLFPELHTSPEPRRYLDSPSTAVAAASHPRSSAPAAPPPPTDAHRPAQFHSPALDRPHHCAGELELPPPLGLTVVPTIHCLLAPAKQTTNTTSSRGSFLATSPPLSCSPATGTPSPPLGAPPPAPVYRRTAATVPLFPNTGHPHDRRELLNLSPHFPLTAGEPPRWDLIATDCKDSKLSRGLSVEKAVPPPPISNQSALKIYRKL
jgi:hypothetical protein